VSVKFIFLPSKIDSMLCSKSASAWLSEKVCFLRLRSFGEHNLLATSEIAENICFLEVII